MTALPKDVVADLEAGELPGCGLSCAQPEIARPRSAEILRTIASAPRRCRDGRCSRSPRPPRACSALRASRSVSPRVTNGRGRSASATVRSASAQRGSGGATADRRAQSAGHGGRAKTAQIPYPRSRQCRPRDRRLARSCRPRAPRAPARCPARRCGARARRSAFSSCIATGPNPFTAEELALQQSFADQAVIAIENARLFNETKEALERQTATADILKVIASSPSDVQPVFDAIATSAKASARWLLDARCFASSTGSSISKRSRRPVRPPTKYCKADLPTAGCRFAPFRTGASWRDVSQSPIPKRYRLRADAGHRAGARLPQHAVRAADERRRADRHHRRHARPARRVFADHHVQLLQTFADQAVIAIENARLFNEVQAKTRELTEALTYQTGSSNILSVIASSPTMSSRFSRPLSRVPASFAKPTMPLVRLEGRRRSRLQARITARYRDVWRGADQPAMWPRDVPSLIASRFMSTICSHAEGEEFPKPGNVARRQCIARF